MALTELFVRTQPGGIRSIVDIARHHGNIFFVGTVAIEGGTVGSDASGRGKSPTSPLATIDYAIGLCTAGQGDVIYVLPGHNEGLGDAQIAVDKAGISIIGLGGGVKGGIDYGPGVPPRIDFDHANASIDVSANGVTIRNLRLLPSVTAVAIGIDVNAAVTDTILEDIETLPGEDGAGVDEFAIAIDIKAGCSRTKIVRPEIRQHASAAGVVAGVKLTGASDDVKVIGPGYIEALGAAAVAPVNADTTLSTHVLLDNLILVSDTQPGVEVITGTTGVCRDLDIFTNLATIAAAITGNGGASGMAQFRCQYIEVAPESGAVVGTPSADD